MNDLSHIAALAGMAAFVWIALCIFITGHQDAVRASEAAIRADHAKRRAEAKTDGERWTLDAAMAMFEASRPPLAPQIGHHG